MGLTTWIATVGTFFSPGQALEILVPAYFAPAPAAVADPWAKLRDAAQAGVGITAILNVNNGPGEQRNADYAAAVTALRAAGGRVLGYVHTCYGKQTCSGGLPSTRTPDDILRDANRYDDWYKVDGIFLDEMANTLAELPFYHEVATKLRGAHARWQLIGNAGTIAPVEYLEVVDSIVTYEGSATDFATAATVTWADGGPAERQASLVYNVASEEMLTTLLRAAVQRQVGYVYFTDDRYVPGSTNPALGNPWDQLPTFWSAEVAAVGSTALCLPKHNL